MRRVFPVLANQGSSRPLFQTDYQSFFEAVPYQMLQSGPSLDLAHGVRDITSCQKRGRWATMTSLKLYEKHGRLNDTWRLLSPATQAYCLTCEHDAEGYILAGKTSFATETGPMSSQPLAEISGQPHVASTACLLGYRARHWLPLISTVDGWTFVWDRLSPPRHRWPFCTGPAWRQPCGFAPCALQGRWRPACARSLLPMDVNLWIDPQKKLDKQTTIELHLCCFGSPAFSPCTAVLQGCSKERLGTLAVDHKLRCHGRRGFWSFRLGHKHLETRLASRTKRR